MWMLLPCVEECWVGWLRLEDIKREAEMLQRLDHPNIVPWPQGAGLWCLCGATYAVIDVPCAACA